MGHVLNSKLTWRSHSWSRLAAHEASARVDEFDLVPRRVLFALEGGTTGHRGLEMNLACRVGPFYHGF